MKRQPIIISPYLTIEYIKQEQERRKQRGPKEVIQENRQLGWLYGILGVLLTGIGWLIWRKP